MSMSVKAIDPSLLLDLILRLCCVAKTWEEKLMRMTREQSEPTSFFKRRGEQTHLPFTRLVKAFLY